MSSKTSSSIFHPKLLAIQQHLGKINQSIVKAQALITLKTMILCIYELAPVDRDDELLQAITSAYKTCRNIKNQVMRARYFKLNESTFWDYIDRLQSSIWSAGYNDVNKYFGDNVNAMDFSDIPNLHEAE